MHDHFKKILIIMVHMHEWIKYFEYTIHSTRDPFNHIVRILIHAVSDSNKINNIHITAMNSVND